MVEAIAFIGLAIVALVQLGKFLFPKEGEKRDVRGAAVIIGAALLGVVVGIVDTEIGIVDVSIAQGLILALDAVGLHTLAREV